MNQNPKPTRRTFKSCPRCNADLIRSKSINGSESEFWLECSSASCNTYVNTYIPQAHQMAVHKDNHRFTGNFGGYGTGKTTTSREEVYKHVFITPGGNTLIGANIAPQYEQTIKRDIENDLPAAFIKSYSIQKQYFDLLNGHRIMYRPLDDQGKLRSYNLSMFVMVEASEVKQESFTQLKTRLRNMAAMKPYTDEDGNPVMRNHNGTEVPKIQYNWCKGIIESNPDVGWIRSEVLQMSSEINKHGMVLDFYTQDDDKKDPAISSHIASSDVNAYLPPTFKEDITKNKPLWWVNRFYYGSFLYAEGLVYPSAQRYVCEDFEIPRHWLRIVAADYGLSDNFVYLFGAVSPEDNVLVIYKEVVINNRSIEQLAKLFFENVKDIPLGGWICPPLLDPKSAPKRDYDKVSLADKFLDYGINFKPGQINVDARVYGTNTYFESGKIRMFRKGCPVLIKELSEYKFKTNASDDQGFSDKPEDKNNHCINALEWIVMELPRDPNKLVLGVYDKQGRDIMGDVPAKNDTEAYYRHLFKDDSELHYASGTAYEMEDIF